MGVLIKIDGVTFDEDYVIGKVDVPSEPEEVLSITDYPVQDGLQGLYDLGKYDGLGNDNDSLENHAQNPTYAPDGGAPKLDGDCVIEDNYVTFQGATAKASRMLTYLRLPLDGGLTYVALFSVPSGYRPVISNAGSGVPQLSLFNDEVSFGSNNTTQGADFDSVINSNNFAIVAVTADTSGVRAVRYSNGYLNEIATHAGNIDTWTTNAIQIGGNGTSIPYSPAHISLAAVHTGKLEKLQLESVCEFVRKYGKQKGLVIE